MYEKKILAKIIYDLSQSPTAMKRVFEADRLKSENVNLQSNLHKPKITRYLQIYINILSTIEFLKLFMHSQSPLFMRGVLTCKLRYLMVFIMPPKLILKL